MYGYKELKTELIIDDNSIECPVKDCSVIVERQRRSFKREQKYLCSIHNIYISPSTFEYENDSDNMLWSEINDKLLYNDILKVKRECRISRDNSEDALTWNVMRFLDRNKYLPKYLSQLSDKNIKEAELILWSFSPSEKSNWSMLNKARLEFGETIERGSEPDIIILTNKVLYFIEAKLTAFNETKPTDLNNKKRYQVGDNKFYNQIIKSDYETIAFKDKRYELMRFWILGSWIAKQLCLDFEFYSLVLQSRERQLESHFKKHIIESNERKYFRLTWESIYKFIDATEDSTNKQLMIEYLNNKTIGYNSNRKLVKAFFG